MIMLLNRMPKLLLVGILALSHQVSFSENALGDMTKQTAELMNMGQDAAKESMDEAMDKAAKDAEAAMAKLPSYTITLLTQNGEPDEPSKDFQWTTDTIKLSDEGDLKRGEELATKGKCRKCHGDTGISEDDDTPSIAGQITAYSFKQLHDYKVGLRESKEMLKKVRNLSLKDMADISAYFATQEREKKQEGKEIPVLANVGDKKRYLLACNYCHNDDSMKRGYQTPILEGQKIEYFKETMMAFKDGDRVNDHYSLMRGLSGKLTEEEIDELAKYYSAKPSDDD